MSKGPGRIERAIRELFDAHPDEAFTTAELCVACYPKIECSWQMKREHRVAVVRAAKNVVKRDPDWAAWWMTVQGRGLVWYNQRSLGSTVMALVLRDGPGDTPTEVREVAQLILESPADMSPGALAEAQQTMEIAKRRVAEHLERRVTMDNAQLEKRAQGLSAVRSLGNTYLKLSEQAPFRRLLSRHQTLAAAAAAEARALMTANDPDKIRAGLAEIAEALESVSRP
jgi:hypothetical protein